jgi:hypothetical protein
MFVFCLFDVVEDGAIGGVLTEWAKTENAGMEGRAASTFSTEAIDELMLALDQSVKIIRDATSYQGWLGYVSGMRFSTTSQFGPM